MLLWLCILPLWLTELMVNLLYIPVQFWSHGEHLHVPLGWGLLSDPLTRCLLWPIHPSLWGPEGGRSVTAHITPAGNKSQAARQLQHHRAFPFCSPDDDGRFFFSPFFFFFFFTCPQHQTHVAFSKSNDMVSSLSRAHLLTLTPVLVFFPLRIYMESVVRLCSVLWGV